VFVPQSDANTVALWHFQEGMANTVADNSSRGHNGTFINGNWADGYLGYTGHFNGSSTYVEIPHHSDLNPSQVTVEAWIYLTSRESNYPHVINKDAYWLRVMGDGNIEFNATGDGGDRKVSSARRLQLNQWYHVAGTHDGSWQRVYINGVLEGERHNPVAIRHRDTPVRIGWANNWPDAGRFPGYIQHARISNVARTEFPYARVDVAPSLAVGSPLTPPETGTADLVVLSLDTYPAVDGQVLVQATVQNQGTTSTRNGFSTDLYLDEIPNGPGDYQGSVQFWVNEPIPAGATVALTTILDEMPSVAAQRSPMDETTSILYAQVDSAGVVSEEENNNNIYSRGTELCFTTADGYESDGAHSSATNLTLNSPQVHNLHQAEDQDWYVIQASEGEAYAIYTSELDSRSDTVLSLYGSDGATLLASNDDAGESLASRIDWVAPSAGTYYVQVRHWNPNAGGCGTRYTIAFAVPPQTDFNGDGKADILWRHAATGQNSIYLMNGKTVISNSAIARVSDLDYKVAGNGDFTGDGKADILWRHATTGYNVLWIMNGTTIAASATINRVSDLNWNVAGVADFNGDGKADILWRHASTGQNSIYLMNGKTVISNTAVARLSDLNYKVAGIGDFTGDGKADILWRHHGTGYNYLWTMNGATVVSSQTINRVSDLNWKVAGVADFNGDGKADIVWRNASTGQNSIYLMSGKTVISQTPVTRLTDLNYTVAGTDDFTGDGKADILWRHHGTGYNYLWTMNGATIVSSQAINRVSDLNMKIVGFGVSPDYYNWNRLAEAERARLAAAEAPEVAQPGTLAEDASTEELLLEVPADAVTEVPAPGTLPEDVYTEEPNIELEDPLPGEEQEPTSVTLTRFATVPQRLLVWLPLGLTMAALAGVIARRAKHA
jgi:hypothetical protein